MSDTPPAPLLRLRESDVVRLCGLDAVAAGIDMVTRRTIGDCRRTGGQLSAVIHEEPSCAATAELDSAPSPPRLRWRCTIHTGEDATYSTASGCGHIAALLTAWIRNPGDFHTTQALGEATTHEQLPAPRPRTVQPVLVEAANQRRSRGPITLRDELARVPGQEVVDMARRTLGVELDEHEARRVLAALLADPAQVAPIVERLDASIQQLLTDVLCMSGAITAADLEGLAARSSNAPSTVRARMLVLERHGLVYKASHPASGRTSGHAWHDLAGWRIPAEIRAALPRQFPAAPISTPNGQVPAPPVTGDSGQATRRGRLVPGTPGALLLGLALLARARHLYQNRPDASQSNRPRRRGAPPFPLIPGDLPDYQAAELARAVGVPVGLARLVWRVHLWARESGQSQDAMQEHAIPREEWPAYVRIAFRLWRAAESPAELTDLAALPVGPIPHFDAQHQSLRPALLAAEIQEARQFVTDLLSLAQVGEWYALTDLMDAIWRVRPLYLRARQAALEQPAWWLERSGQRRPLRVTVREEWEAGDGAFARYMITAPLYWWGAVDLAADPAGQPYAFRLTPFGAFLFGTVETKPSTGVFADETAGPAILVTKDGALAVQPLAAGPDLIHTLDQWAQVQSLAGGRLLYRLSADLACRQFDQGARLDTLPVFLHGQTFTGAERVAATIQTQLEAWHARYARTSIESGWVVIEAADEALLAEALSLLPGETAVHTVLDGGMALIAESDMAALHAALVKRGYLT